jgi:hypothetical protein
VGLAAVGGGLAEIAAGVVGTAATWVASTGARAAVWGGLHSHSAWLLAGWGLPAAGGQARVFFGEELRCLALGAWPIVTAPSETNAAIGHGGDVGRVDRR